MAEWIQPNSNVPTAYKGLPRIYEYTNHDGELYRTNCGLAASATYLTHRGIFPPGAEGVMARLEKDHPPNIFFGKFGTSRRRVERMCAAYDVELEPIEGVDALKAKLDAGQPVIVMCQMPVETGRILGIPTGHWMVVYGYDSEYLYLTNYGYMPWPQFLGLWEGFISGMIRMANTGLVAKADSGGAVAALSPPLPEPAATADV